MKEQFIKIYSENIHREGADKLLAWLESSDFFTAPASTKYHLSVESGLVTHSLHVYERLKAQRIDLINPVGIAVNETIAIAALLHDLCKVGIYKTELRNRKNEQGEWVKEPYYTIDDQLPYGHGEKSVYIISGFMRLTREEAMAIRWHMGGFDDSVKAGRYEVSKAFEKHPLALHLHIADLQAAYFDEVQR